MRQLHLIALVVVVCAFQIVATNAAWSTWTECTVSCGTGVHTRHCLTGTLGCDGPSAENCFVDCSNSSSSSSTAGQEESSSSSTGVAESSSTGPISSSSSTGESSSSSSTGEESNSTSSSSTGGESSSSSSGSGNPGQECGPGTYSDDGYGPCYHCPHNTYANLRETQCTSCPVHTHIPSGTIQDSLTRCICDDGYTSLWASGGPCYPSEGTPPSYDYCQQGTYSDSGSSPCTQCPNNTYSNVGETECHHCPAHMHILGGGTGASRSDCVCDDGYDSQWATGGPCYQVGNESSSSSGEQGQGESSSTGIVESSSGGSSGSNSSCSQYTSGFTCRRDYDCQPVYAHMCNIGKWKFISCESKDYYDSASKNGTCAKDSDGNRGWFPSRALPDGWSVVPINKKCGACCIPDHQTGPGSNSSSNVGTGCSFVNGSACVLIEFEGACPSNDSLNTWRLRVIQAVATIVSTRLNVSRSDATIGLTVGAIPRSENDNTICSVHLQIYPPETGNLTANDFMMAIWDQLGGDSLLTNTGSKDAGDGSDSGLPSNVAGIAGYRTYGSLPQDLTDASQDTVIVTTSAGNMIEATFITLITVATTAAAALVWS